MSVKASKKRKSYTLAYRREAARLVIDTAPHEMASGTSRDPYTGGQIWTFLGLLRVAKAIQGAP
jgi:hypothetical protein